MEKMEDKQLEIKRAETLMLALSYEMNYLDKVVFLYPKDNDLKEQRFSTIDKYNVLQAFRLKLLGEKE